MKTILKRLPKQHTHKPLIPAGVITVAAGAAGYLLYRAVQTKRKEIPMPVLFHLTSPAFNTGDAIPATYTCQGANISPPLELTGTPIEARALALVLRDPDAPSGDFVHWVIWNIHPDITSLAEGRVPTGAVEGQNDFGHAGYGGPCPPSGTHHYHFELYALDEELDLPPDASRQAILSTIMKHAIGKTELIGTVSA